MYRLITYFDKSKKSVILEDPTDQQTTGYSSMSAGYETIEELKEKSKIFDEPCKICDNIFGTNYFKDISDELRSKGICFHCNFWQDKIDVVNDKRVARIDGSHYVVGEETNGNSNWKGFGGRKFKIKFFDERIVETSNLWHQGEIPEQFRAALPDNAEFVIKNTVE